MRPPVRLLGWLPGAVWLSSAAFLAHEWPLALTTGAMGIGLLAVAWRAPDWLGLALLGAAACAVLLRRPEHGSLLLLALLSLAGAAAHGWRQRRRRLELEREREALARQVDRRINEIFSLQELSYVLAESLQSDRIASQVARYVLRFLGAQGSAVALVQEDGRSLHVAAADGTLAESAGRQITDESPSLLLRSITTERIEVSQNGDQGAILLPGHPGSRGAAAPLRAHGLTMGVLAVDDRRPGGFTTEDLWLLSTVATHVAVVLANSRLFEMVRRAKEEWETAFNALTEGIAVLDAGGRVSRANGALARMLDLPPTAVLGRSFWATVVGDEEGEDQLIGAARRGERPPSRILRSAPLSRMLRLTAAPLAEPAEHAAVVVLVGDVTEQRQLEAQLIQSEKLAAVGQLVSGVAHELNNPLTSIAGLSEFLQEREGLPSGDREHLRVIHDQAQRAGRIVRNLLTFARKGAPAAGVVDLNDILERTALLVAYELRLRGIQLDEDRPAGPLPVRGNRDELQQVVLNLVTNAGHALRNLPAGQPRRITLVARRDADHAVVKVRDTGPGVAPALVPQLFTPFFTTKEPGEGTGLGLSLSFRLVEAHGGRLEYQPAAGGGAEFSFRLPLVSETPTAARLTPLPGALRTPLERAALVMGDDSGSELVVRALLEPAGYEVEVARTGADAVGSLARRPWSVLVVDGGLSADGRRLLVDQLVTGLDYSGAPRLLVTTADPDAVERWRDRGVTILPKPFLPRDLLLAVNDLIDVD